MLDFRRKRRAGSTFAEAAKEYPGNNLFGMHINFSA